MELKPKQLEAAILLVSGETITAAAEKVGVSRQAIYDWLGNNLFKSYLNSLKQESIDTAVSQIQNATCQAVKEVLYLMKNSRNDAVCLAAAKLILESTHVIDRAHLIGSTSVTELDMEDYESKKMAERLRELTYKEY